MVEKMKAGVEEAIPGSILNVANAAPLSDLVLKFMEAGGMLSYYRKLLAK
ncbi:MAG TPA: hypothetical protein VN381_04730 [Anaerovoracaceae bacterium]|nr:hypothetical protein [Anaerovoracaceae bacterium]